MSSRTTYEGRGENRYTTGPREDLGRAIRLNRAESNRTEPMRYEASRAESTARSDPLTFWKRKAEIGEIIFSSRSDENTSKVAGGFLPNISVLMREYGNKFWKHVNRIAYITSARGHGVYYL